MRSSTAPGGVEHAVRVDLDDLVCQVPEGPDRDAFSKEMDDFYRLFSRYLHEKKHSKPLDWEKVRGPKPEDVIAYGDLEAKQLKDIKPLLNKLAVLKLNGGLGTTMGCVGPKSAIEVRDSQTFLDLTVQQIEYLNQVSDADVPLILMNSFNTDEDTKKIVQKYSAHNVNICTFNQSRYPRFKADSNLPLAQSPDNRPGFWYPPGHGDL
ncbi:UTP-glucose-1-phosphate uridylyltransferase, partial [Coemansia sp. S85]